MTEKPLVSVIINCYNGEKYLREAIDSVMAQTYENWELVFWDNQSTDSTREIVESYGDPRIHYFYAPEHTPLGEARNLAMKKASGDYVAFLDSDDVWLAQWVEKFVVCFEDDLSIGLVYCNFITCEQNVEKEVKGLKCDALVSMAELLSNYNIGMSGAAVRLSVIKSNGISINNHFSLLEDYDFFLRIACYCKVMYCHNAYMRYRVHTGNLSQSPRWSTEMHCFKDCVVENDQYKLLKPYLSIIESNLESYEFTDLILQHRYFRAFLMKPRSFMGLLKRGFRKF